MTGLPINWFDLTLAAILIAGAVTGRRKGMSEEFLPVMQWLSIVAVGALFYRPLGELLSAYTGITLLVSFIVSYALVAALIRLGFGWIKTMVGEKLVGSDVFGRVEFSMGAFAGTLRFACILLAVLAVLHARYFSPQELAAQARMQRENFGSITFPTLGAVQQSIFDKSITGRFIEKYLSAQLIASTSPRARAFERLGIGKRRENMVNEALGEPRPTK